jgi:hypothetical protein
MPNPASDPLRGSLTRRRFLRSAGAALALPALERFAPPARAAGPEAGPPRRLLAICNNLSMLPDRWFPKATTHGPNYALSPYLELIATHREDFTVMSGVSHPDVDGGHPADICFLTAAPHPASGGFHNTISLDQHIGQHIGHLTRFPSLTLGVNVEGGSRSLSWTPGGVAIPCEQSPSALYRKLFVQGSPDEVKKQVTRLELGRSIMDTVLGQAESLQRDLSARDRERVEQYTTSVRDLERRLHKAQAWENIPRRTVKAPAPADPEGPRKYLERASLLLDLAVLAFETDSTRLITLMLDAVSSPALDVPGTQIKDGYHSLSHHGKNPGKLAQLEAIERQHMLLLGRLFEQLATRVEVTEGGGPHARLLDRAMVIYGSNMGNANSHLTNNLPVLFAGGGFRHGQHLVFDTARNYPLPNLFVNVLQRFGLPDTRFASSTGPMKGLELA